MSRSKGRRTLNKAIKYYESEGWLVDECELGGRFRASRDLFSTPEFGGFDLVCLRPGTTKYVQVKTNQPPNQGDYASFAQTYAGRNVLVESYTWFDRAGPVIHRFHKNGKVERMDLRK